MPWEVKECSRKQVLQVEISSQIANSIKNTPTVMQQLTTNARRA